MTQTMTKTITKPTAKPTKKAVKAIAKPIQTVAPEPLRYGEDTGVERWLWTREDYYCAALEGWFEGQRVELIRGEVYRKMTQNPPHYSTIYVTAKVLEEAFGPNFCVRQQGPIPLLDDSEPEPDILVAIGSWRDYTERHPTVAETALAIEVSDTTLHMDSGKKMALYAEAGVADYWVLNINARTLKVHRDPAPLLDEPDGFGYRSVTIYSETDSIAPVAKPEITLRVADLLPPIAPTKKASPKRKHK